MFEFVEKVIYINSDDQIDKRQQIESELTKYFPSEIIIRFSAITNENHVISSTKTHIAVLEMAIQEGWKNILIVEDYVVWSNFEEGYEKLENLIKKPFDVIMLDCEYPKYLPEFKVLSAQSCSSYIVKQHYYKKLLRNFKESLNGFLTTGNYAIYALDQYWKRIQPLDDWYCIIPSLMKQQET